MAVDSLSAISGRKEALAPPHSNRFMRIIRTVPCLHHVLLAPAFCAAYSSSIPRSYPFFESSFYVFLRCVRQDVALPTMVLVHISLPPMRTQITMTVHALFTRGPNQTMKLTATFVRFGDAFLRATFLSPKVGLSPSGRSLSFSR